MWKRKSILLGIIVLVVCLGVSIMFAAMKEPPKRREARIKELILPVRTIQNETITMVISAVGSLEAHEKMEVYAEVNGILEKAQQPFLEGVGFQKGETLLKIRDDKFRSSLYAKKSSLMNQIALLLPDLKFDFPNSYQGWKNYLAGFSIEESLKPIPEPMNEQEKYFIAGKNLYQTYYDIQSMEEELLKYTVCAPFTGKITESNIKTGTLVRSGQKLGEFLNTSTYDLVVGVNLNDLSDIRVGDSASLKSETLQGGWQGRVSRISPKLDEKTQMVDVYISVSGKDLKEGMFLSADIHLSKEAFGVEIPRKLIMNGSKLLVVENDIVKEQEVSVLQYKEDTAIVDGLTDGSLLALKTSGIHKGLTVKAVEQK